MEAAMAKTAKSSRRASSTRKWSAEVTRNSHALALDADVFTLDSPKRIAASLKRSAERSHERKSEPYRSAMSMLTFYINRAGKHLSATRKKTLESAKDELRRLFGRK
jgi:phosphoenolpyruvate carboxylase